VGVGVGTGAAVGWRRVWELKVRTGLFRIGGILRGRRGSPSSDRASAYAFVVVLFILFVFFVVIRVADPAFFEALDGSFDVLKFVEHVFFLGSVKLANFCELAV